MNVLTCKCNDIESLVDHSFIYLISLMGLLSKINISLFKIMGVDFYNVLYTFRSNPVKTTKFISPLLETILD
jgi:hypothetical protein